jgi:hypothetical protein
MLVWEENRFVTAGVQPLSSPPSPPALPGNQGDDMMLSKRRASGGQASHSDDVDGSSALGSGGSEGQSAKASSFRWDHLLGTAEGKLHSQRAGGGGSSKYNNNQNDNNNHQQQRGGAGFGYTPPTGSVADPRLLQDAQDMSV